MKYKTDEVRKRWEFTERHAALESMMPMVEDYIVQHFHFEPTMTESRRTRQETITIYNDPVAKISPHEIIPLPACDLRSSDFTGDQIKELVGWVNAHWIYDPSRPQKVCAMCHEVNGHGAHFHFQTCDKTVYRGD